METEKTLEEQAFGDMRADIETFVCGVNVPGIPKLPSGDVYDRILPRVSFSAHHRLWLKSL